MSEVRAKSEQQLSVEEFMRKKQLELPDAPVDRLTHQERVLCARLLLEETLETLRNGLGVIVRLREDYPATTHVWMEGLEFGFDDAVANFDIVEVADGTADVRYVSHYIDSLCGIASLPIDREVAANNLAKFGPGSYIDDAGKLRKPPGYKAPDIAGLIEQQRLACQAS